MNEILASIPWKELLGGFIYALLEAWLGKTPKLESGSALELIARAFSGKRL